ncbi:MAG: acyl-CoA thioesterase/BAAT N-terminal domain-containing protein, partial [Sphingomonas sp.]
MHEDVEIRLDRLQPRQLVTLRAELVDRRRIVWRSEAVMRADARGRIDVARSAALSGTYRGIDRYGLFWSMEPVAGGGEAFIRAASEPRHSLVPVLRHTEPFTIEIQALADGVELGRATLARRWSDQRTRAVEIEEGQVRGILYEPA